MLYFDVDGGFCTIPIMVAASEGRDEIVPVRDKGGLCISGLGSEIDKLCVVLFISY